MLDLLLAVAHHLLVFGLAGVVAAELALVSPRMGAVEVRRLAAVDVAYGALASLVLAIGCLRVLFAAKGWAYYAGNLFFWGKMAAFLAMGLASVLPSVRFVRWRRALVRDQALPPAPEIARVLGLLWLEAGLFAVVLTCAAAMARGFGAS